MSDALAPVEITVYFGLPQTGGDWFTLDDPTKGMLDGAYLLAGDVGSKITDNCDLLGFTTRRGRNRALDEFEVGTINVDLDNLDRLYDGTDSGSPYFGATVPGKRIVVTVWGRVVFDGAVEDWDLEWTESSARAALSGEDGLAVLGRAEFSLWTTTAGQTAGSRLTDIMNRPEVNYGIRRDFDTGISTLASEDVTWGSQVLNYAQLVAKSDGGRLFVTRDGTLRYQDRHDLINASPTVNFTGDDETGIQFAAVGITTGAELLFTRVQVDREGGILQTVQDDASVAEYGVRALSMPGLLLDSDEQSLDMAEYMLSLYKDPETRVSSITVVVNDLDPSDRGTVTALDIGDVVSFVWTPRGIGDTIDQLLAVEGVDHSVIGPGIHTVTLHTSSALQFGVFILDDPMWGMLDAGNRLAF